MHFFFFFFFFLGGKCFIKILNQAKKSNLDLVYFVTILSHLYEVRVFFFFFF